MSIIQPYDGYFNDFIKINAITNMRETLIVKMKLLLYQFKETPTLEPYD